jgi:ParB family transcriptional regulator, chromosome partitioning protein
MEILQIDPARIEVVNRLRAVDSDYVEMLAQSIAERGLDAPIRVTLGDADGRHRLIAGAHRLAAVRLLGLPSIAAIPFDGTELQAELVEIEENLIRRELSEMDRATFLARHKAVWLALYPEAKQGGDRRRRSKSQDGTLIGHPLSERFSDVAAKKLGISRTSVFRAIRRHEALPVAVRDRIASTWIADNGSALDDLIGRAQPLTAAEQHAVLDLLLDPTMKLRGVNDALRLVRRLPAPDVSVAAAKRLDAAWKSAPARVQREFLERVLRGNKALREAARAIAARVVEGDDEAEQDRLLQAISGGRRDAA